MAAPSSSLWQRMAAYLRSPFTPLLLFVPLGLVIQQGSVNPLLVFLINGLAIIPLANLISGSVEEVSEHLGDQWGGCLNATFGNLVELVIALSALTGGLYDVVLDGLVGGLVTNLLLVLGLATVVGGLRHRRMQISASTALLNAKLLMAVMMVAFVPSALNHLGMFRSADHHSSYSVLLALALLVFYGLSYVYQFFTHGELFRQMPMPFEQEALHPHGSAVAATGLPSEAGTAAADPGEARQGLLAALLMLGLTTLVLIACSQGLVDGLAGSVRQFRLTSFFTGVFLLPLFGSAAEFVIALRSAQRNRMDLAVATTVGSSIQIVLFVLPLLVLIGVLIGRPLGIFFSPQAMIAVITSVFAVQWVTEDSSLDWFEGSFLVLVYVLLFASTYFLL